MPRVALLNDRRTTRTTRVLGPFVKITADATVVAEASSFMASSAPVPLSTKCSTVSHPTERPAVEYVRVAPGLIVSVTIVTPLSVSAGCHLDCADATAGKSRHRATNIAWVTAAR